LVVAGCQPKGDDAKEPKTTTTSTTAPRPSLDESEFYSGLARALCGQIHDSLAFWGGPGEFAAAGFDLVNAEECQIPGGAETATRRLILSAINVVGSEFITQKLIPEVVEKALRVAGEWAVGAALLIDAVVERWVSLISDAAWDALVACIKAAPLKLDTVSKDVNACTAAHDAIVDGMRNLRDAMRRAF
jgi:hypothetical protein